MTSKPMDLTTSVVPSQRTTIPFGKYRGHTIEDVLIIDPKYLEWLSLQDWFRTQHVHLHQVIINGAQSEETPEHNKLQVLFHDDDFCLRVINAAGFECDRISWRDFELAGIDVVLGFEFKVKNAFEATKEGDIIDESAEVYYGEEIAGIEIKPSVGDDYPAVLRQMRAASVRFNLTNYRRRYFNQILCLVSYTGIGATRQQFVATFKAAGIAVVFIKKGKEDR
jgi:uncharacterized protein (DUF3820 family)